MYEREKSDPAEVARKLTNAVMDHRRSRWSEGRGQGEHDKDPHAPDTERGKHASMN
jgi:hypothetical protein